jgi:serine/threonine protein kinase
VHFNRIIHCDIKPENLLIDARGRVQIGDFGISYVLEDGMKDVHVIQNGTMLFTPPCALVGMLFLW